MSNEKCIIAGFGGQGVMLMGQLLAQGGMEEELCVSWLPSYGPEMRGGTANCMVMIAENEIPSPVIDHDASSIIIMNRPSLPKFLPHLLPGGVCLINKSLIEDTVERDDVKTVYVPCTEIASELGNLKMTNMVMLGAFIEATGCLKAESVLTAMEHKLGAKKAHLMEGNREAFMRGAANAREQLSGGTAGAEAGAPAPAEAAAEEPGALQASSLEVTPDDLATPEATPAAEAPISENPVVTPAAADPKAAPVA